MNKKKTILIPTGLALAASLFATAVTALLLTDYYSRAYFQELGAVCQAILNGDPGAETKLAVLSALKGYTDRPRISNILPSLAAVYL